MSTKHLDRLIKKGKGITKEDVDAFYKSYTWQKCREAILERDDYLCQICIRGNIPTPANTVHHIIHLRDNPRLALESSNLISVCFDCHNELHPEKGIGKKKEKEISNKIKFVEVDQNPKNIWG